MPSLPVHRWLSFVLGVTARPPASLRGPTWPGYCRILWPRRPVLCFSNAFPASCMLFLFLKHPKLIVPWAPAPRVFVQDVYFCLGNCPRISLSWFLLWFALRCHFLRETYATTLSGMAMRLDSHLTTALWFLSCMTPSTTWAHLICLLVYHCCLSPSNVSSMGTATLTFLFATVIPNF